MQPQKRAPSLRPHGVLTLTPEDVKRLLSPDSAAARTEVSMRVAQEYAQSSFDARESVIAEQIFRLLVRDTEVKLRAALSEQLKSSKTLPKDIALCMAKDVEEVAMPMLRYSEVLSDDDLIPLVRGDAESWRQVAVSERSAVSEALSDALLESDRREVAEALVRNQGAQIRERALHTVFERFGEAPAMAELLAARATIPVTLAEKLVHVVSGQLAEGLRKKYPVAAPQVVKEEAKTRETGTLALLRERDDPVEVERLAMQLYAYGRLSPSIVLNGLGEGNMHFFEASLAMLAGIPPGNAHTLLHDRGDLGFRAIYNKSGMPNELFTAVRDMFAAVQRLTETKETPRGADFCGRVMERVRQGSGDADALFAAMQKDETQKDDA